MPTATEGSRSRPVRANRRGRRWLPVLVAAAILLGRGCTHLERPKLEDSGFLREVRPRSSLVFSKSSRGFQQYTLSPSNNIVLIYNREQTNKTAHIKLVTELALELKNGIPLNRVVSAEDWVISALYRYGGPRLQFESTHFRGSLSISSLSSEDRSSGDRLDLTFFDPSIDVAGVHEAPVNIGVAPAH